MILIDFSSILHRMLHTSISSSEAQKIDGKFLTEEFAGLMKYYIMQDLFSIQQEHGPNFGELVLCLDNSENGYWRNDVYSAYKGNRTKTKDISEVEFGEVFDHTNALIAEIKNHLPWRVIEVPRAEADDIMLVLAKEFKRTEKILIHSPDKDMIQAQRDTDNVYQWSALTKKWIVAETKSDHMNAWVQQHIILGDAGDGVPRVVDHTEFSENFLKYLGLNGYPDIKTPMDFKGVTLDREVKINLLSDYQIYRLNRKKEETDIKDVYVKPSFGVKKMAKVISEAGSLDTWLDSHPLYRPHYDRNFTLVMEEGIPPGIWNEAIIQYKQAETQYNMTEFTTYLNENNLNSISMELSNYFKSTEMLTGEDW